MEKGLVPEEGGLRLLFSEGGFDKILEHCIECVGMSGISASASVELRFTDF
ncbi:MAG: hypothetical protein LIP03_14135 [Bacteroidales bacterium]|nr:hypothetical protein [Bacteroidales bacterium]